MRRWRVWKRSKMPVNRMCAWECALVGESVTRIWTQKRAYLENGAKNFNDLLM